MDVGGRDRAWHGRYGLKESNKARRDLLVVFALHPPHGRTTARSHRVALHPAPFLSVALGLDGVERTGQPALREHGKEVPS